MYSLWIPYYHPGLFPLESGNRWELGGTMVALPRLVGFELQKLKSHFFKAGGARGGIFVRSCLVKMQVFGERPHRYFKNSHW